MMNRHNRRISKAPHIMTIHHLVTDAIIKMNENFFFRFINISSENSFFLPYIEKRAVESVDLILAVSNYTKNKIIETYNVEEPKIKVIYNGVENFGYNFSDYDLNSVKLKYNIKNKPVILFVGRIDDSRKGLDILIKAFKIVLKNVDAQLVIVGSGKKEKLMDLAGPIVDSIVFFGYVDEVTLKKCYAMCDIYVCPSRLEGFGLTILEAFAAGKPVVATNVGAIPELIQAGNGTLVEKDDIPDMASAILYYLKNPYLFENIGVTNIKKINEKFKWETSAKDLERTYEKLGIP